MKTPHSRDSDYIQSNVSIRIVVICFILCPCDIFFTLWPNVS